MSGPYETRREAAAAVAHILATKPGGGAWEKENLALLTDACAAAGVETGAFGLRILHWLAGAEPETCAVIADLIARASEAGKRPPPRPRLRETKGESDG